MLGVRHGNRAARGRDDGDGDPPRPNPEKHSGGFFAKEERPTQIDKERLLFISIFISNQRSERQIPVVFVPPLQPLHHLDCVAIRVPEENRGAATATRRVRDVFVCKRVRQRAQVSHPDTEMPIFSAVRRTELQVVRIGIRQFHQVQHLAAHHEPRAVVRELVVRSVGVHREPEHPVVEIHRPFHGSHNHGDVMDALNFDLRAQRFVFRRNAGVHQARAVVVHERLLHGTVTRGLVAVGSSAYPEMTAVQTCAGKTEIWPGFADHTGSGIPGKSRRGARGSGEGDARWRSPR
mmetsp:Transcript_10931/g.40437  ORF Transcript_10931/g.40437 Transcript_10931/m.40437 type:complete len:292 (-) Transcript_10931:218-1093(-)